MEIRKRIMFLNKPVLRSVARLAHKYKHQEYSFVISAFIISMAKRRKTNVRTVACQ